MVKIEENFFEMESELKVEDILWNARVGLVPQNLLTATISCACTKNRSRCGHGILVILSITMYLPV